MDRFEVLMHQTSDSFPVEAGEFFPNSASTSRRLHSIDYNEARALELLPDNQYGIAVNLLSAEKYPSLVAYKEFCDQGRACGFITRSGREDFFAGRNIPSEQVVTLVGKLREAISTADGMPDYLQAHSRLLIAYFVAARPDSAESQNFHDSLPLIEEASCCAGYRIPSSIKKGLADLGLLTPNIKEAKVAFYHVTDELEQLNPEIVILGGTGDLALRLLIPQLHQLTVMRNKHGQAFLGESTKIYVCGRGPECELIPSLTPGAAPIPGMTYQQYFFERCKELQIPLPESIEHLFKNGQIQYVAHDSDCESTELTEILGKGNVQSNKRLIFFALPPAAYEPCWDSIKRFVCRNDSIILEKPFGETPEATERLKQVFAPEIAAGQAHVMDHYLGKAGVIRWLDARRQFLDQFLHSGCVESVQIEISEHIGVKGRGSFYDSVGGAVGDMVQSHMLNLMALVSMEIPPPELCNATTFREHKVELYGALQAFELHQSMLAQYRDYQDEAESPGSNTATFFAGITTVKNDRWDGVPFLLKHGKGINGDKYAFIDIKFKDDSGVLGCPKRATLVIQPHPRLIVQHDDGQVEISVLDEVRQYGTQGEELLAYARVLILCLHDNHFFACAEEAAAQWRLVKNVSGMGADQIYEKGSCGPDLSPVLEGQFPELADYHKEIEPHRQIYDVTY